MAIYSVYQIINKDLFAFAPVTGYYDRPYSENKIFFKPGQNVGKVYSYIQAVNPSGNYEIWWHMYPIDSKGKYYWVKHDPDRLSQTAIREQGAKSEAEIIEEKKKKEEEENNPFGLPDFSSIGKTLLKIGGIALGAWAAVSIAKAYIQRPKNQ